MAVRVEGMHAVVERDGERDEVAVEEPLEIRVDGAPLAVTMRTPGHDEELAAGFLFGEGLLDGLVPLAEHVLCVSGRLSFELVQKAAVAGAPILVGVGAPTSLAVELAADRGLTLCGFARQGRVNVYAGPERVTDDARGAAEISRTGVDSRPSRSS